MASGFLKAEWQNLLFANYAVDPNILLPYLPFGTELDFYKGVCYCSMVGFVFANTRVLGLKVPYHHTFEEVNLRFYVRYKDGEIWKRGVVFVKEIVPRFMISGIANMLYGEKYMTLPMKHYRVVKENAIELEYSWNIHGSWNYLHATTFLTAHPLIPGSQEAYITEHYWGYNARGNYRTGEYQVAHPRWDIYPVNDISCHIDAATLYGAAFTEVLQAKPASVFVATGSAVSVMMGKNIR
ncbi:hypothetical protein SAMN05444008_10284 [Cnuella takakiae]|uniref:DUF2071 domain-containing protein n=1 Tax=Cnuella takakiae TaxID=1302690 RepID=A0A1M4UY22_9BACT|nr:DUF2071 domain-containing protein [Cnuella takakiae]OLY92753.1 hypothetical protein BUE76_13280 [Cnuella takakiae]SHE61651.1 hypothetical protein SAMN05444008_10284 [Cnuella takakiae]